MTVRQRYTDIPQFEEKPVWFSRMGVSEDADSLLAFLRREAPRNGLDTLAFFVPQIAEDLAIVRELAFDSLGVDINDLLPRLDYRLSRPTCAIPQVSALALCALPESSTVCR